MTKGQRWLLAAALVAVGVQVVFAALNWGGCAYYGYQTERDTRYAAGIGCMVRVDAGWVPKNELRVVQ
ncbi:hypothetical protein D9M69_429180 [compost metagenome]